MTDEKGYQIEVVGPKLLNALYQMSMALEKLAFLPFGLLIDKYRWKIFDGKISVDDLQEEWDRMRLQYQGIHPPVKRDSNLFDAGAKYHVPANVPYIRYKARVSAVFFLKKLGIFVFSFPFVFSIRRGLFRQPHTPVPVLQSLVHEPPEK